MRVLSHKSRSQKKLISLVLSLFLFLILSKIAFLYWQILHTMSEKKVEMVLWEEIHAEAFLMAMFWIFSSSILALRAYSNKLIMVGFFLIIIYILSGLFTFFNSEMYLYYLFSLLILLIYQFVAIIISLRFEIKDLKGIRVNQ